MSGRGEDASSEELETVEGSWGEDGRYGKRIAFKFKYLSHPQRAWEREQLPEMFGSLQNKSPAKNRLLQRQRTFISLAMTTMFVREQLVRFVFLSDFGPVVPS